jgi:penicillin-binding protein 1A
LRQSWQHTREQLVRRWQEWERHLPKPLQNRRNQRWIALAAGVILILGTGRLIYWQIDRSLPPSTTLNTFMRRGTVTIKALNGTVLQQVGDATRERVAIDKIPPYVVNAFIASEDRRFYQHKGVDYQGILRAVARNVTSGGLMEGGSTITQQLARMVFLNQERSLDRKLKEAILAQKLEREVDKRKLLEHYLNLVYLGSEAYGVADAAWVYFSKPIDKLTLGEAAMIAGLPPAPSYYSPLINPDLAQQRRNIVLSRMQEQGYISAQEADAAKAEPLKLKKATPKKLFSDSPYFTDYVQQQLPNLVAKDDLEAGGLTIETTLNATWQKAAEKAVKEAIELDGPAEGFGQAALVAIDPSNGEIRAMVGGDDYYKNSQFNRVTQAQRQPGSTFKTFVYTAGIAAGFSPYRSYADERFVVDGYEPKNYGNKYSGWLDLRQALTKSANVVAVRLLLDVGFEPALKMAKNMGIESKLTGTYSLALGAYEVNLLELTSAYGTLAAQGIHTPPHGIRRIVNSSGKVLYNVDVQSKRVVDPTTSSIMTWLLESVVTNGTGQPAQLPDRQVAGKTGTSEKARDLWFVGFVPQVVAGVWLGNDDNAPTYGSSGTAAFTWNQFMKVVAKDLPVEKFPDLPKDLDSRKGSIKAVPIKPKRMYSKGSGPDPQEEQSSTWSDRSYNDTRWDDSPRYNQEESWGNNYDSSSSHSDGYGYSERAEPAPEPSYEDSGHSEPAAPAPAPPPEPAPLPAESVAPPPPAAAPEPPAPEPPPSTSP